MQLEQLIISILTSGRVKILFLVTRFKFINVMDNKLKENIEKFLDDFMLIQYKGNDHIIARQFFRKTFNELIPKYFETKRSIDKITPESSEDSSLIKNIVVIGAGYGGITAALRLERLLKKHPFFSVHLIDKNPYHTIKTQLHEAAVRKAEVSIPLYKILKNRKIHFHLGEVNSIDVENKIVSIDNRTLQFHFLIIAIGSKVNYYNIPGMKEHSFPLQTLYDANNIYEHISKMCALSASEKDEKKRKENLRFVIGGGGLSGVELAAELAEHTSKCLSDFNINKKYLEVILIEAANRLVPFMDEEFSEKIKERLIEKDIKILLNSKIIKRTENEVYLEDGKVIQTNKFFWTGGIRVSDLLKRGGLKTGPAGRVIVNEYLQAEGNKYIYAIGDSANAINPVTGKPVPAAAQFALQQGRLAAENVYAEIFGKLKKSYWPKVLGEVVSLGKHLAIGWLALEY
ncbi:MAG: NAD(P)/FAD-dependent oxidoreductase [Melioribacter sp.]|uniref:NAD(P)/FAD-dependent oxidoreductase n=1 Tax=Melioribacter sp. TaxID=2052167 RepID=UPI003BEC7C4C